MAAKKHKKNDVQSGVILVRQYPNTKTLTDTIITTIDLQHSPLEKKYPAYRKAKNSLRKVFGLKPEKKIIVDFGGVLPSEQRKYIKELGMIKEVKALKDDIQIKDGPFAYSAMQMEKNLFRE